MIHINASLDHMPVEQFVRVDIDGSTAHDEALLPVEGEEDFQVTYLV